MMRIKNIRYLFSFTLILCTTIFLSTCKKNEDAKPTIQSVSPASGKEGDVVVISGTFLGSSQKVKFGTVEAPAVDPKANSVTTQVPAGLSLGTLTIMVEAATGNSNTIPFKVTPPAPEITSINPAEAGAGATLTITGKFFGTVSEVAFGTTKVTPLDPKTETQLTAKVPEGLTLGATDVTLISEGGTSNKFTFTVLGKPTLSDFTPLAGPSGTHVLINGTKFEETTDVFFGTLKGTFEIKSTTQLDAVVPAAAVSGKIKVVTPGGEAVSATDFIVKSPPAVTSFTPANGAAGVQVTITGQNFSAPGTLVKFGTIQAETITVNSDTEILATVPNGTVTAKISVETAAGKGTSATSFVIVGAPTITGFTPPSGAVGTSVTITGTNFINISAVAFNTTAVTIANYTVNSATQITAKVPAGASNGPIKVTTLSGLATSANSFTILGLPVITSFSPTSGAVGASVIINGTDFVGVTAVKFNGTDVGTPNYTVNSAIKITAKVPVGASSGVITVITGVGPGSSTSSFNIIGPPTVTSFSPLSGAIGQSITVNGTSFTAVNAVKFNGVAAITYTVNSVTKITATIPAGATTGKISVEATAGNGASAANFTVAAAPTITSFTPGSAPIGGSVTITGTNFINVSSVKFNGTEVGVGNFTVNSATQIVAKVPVGTTNGTISVTTPSGPGTSSTSFTVIPPPTITGFTPTSGPSGTSVVITGTSLTTASSVKFNNATASYTVNSGTQITATVPAAATTGLISVTTTAGSVNSANSFTVILPPLISSISPTTGIPGTTLTITGSNLANATQVKFNATVVTTYISNSAVEIKVLVPGSLGAGAVNVSVVTLGGTSNTKTFTVVQPAVITDIKPNVSYKGFPILILGTNLKGATGIKIGTTSGTIQTLYDASMMITIPASMANGTYSVTVITEGGASNGISLNIVTAPAGVGSPPGANFVSPPPATFVNAVSNQWSYADNPNVSVFLLSDFGDPCQIVNPGYDSSNPNSQYVCGSYVFTKDGAGNITGNLMQLTLGKGGDPPTDLETFYGQWSATVPDPCFQKLVLISTKDGHVLSAVVDVSFNSDFYPSHTCH